MTARERVARSGAGRRGPRERRAGVWGGAPRDEDAARVAFKAPIIQLVDPEYTVLVKIEKARVPARAL